MSVSVKQILITTKEYLLITIGICIYVIGYLTFMIPNNLIGGGVTGMASIIQYATGGAVKIGYTYFAINLILLIAALFTLGRGFGIKTVYAMTLASIGLSAAQGLIPETIIQSLSIDNGKLMCTIMSGIMIGVGIGMSMSQGGSTGGTDIIALIVNKYRNVSPGRMMLAIDVFVILSSLLVPSYMPDGSLMPFTEKIVTVVYGFILIALTSFVIDLYLSGSRQSMQLMIVSTKYKEIADAMVFKLHRGATILDGQGWYTQEPRKVLMVVARKTDLNMILRCVKSIDPTAFLSVTSVTGVYGQGFDTIKIKDKSRRHEDLTD